jgi:hypothetical protein
MKSKHNFETVKVIYSQVTVKYGRLVVFIRHDFAEICGFKCGLTLLIGTLKIMASTGVFVRVVCVLKHLFSCDPQTPSTILT